MVGGDLADLGVATDAVGESGRACLVLSLDSGECDEVGSGKMR